MKQISDVTAKSNDLLRVLVTGAAGFIGAHVVVHLRTVGFSNVVAITRNDVDLANMDAVVAMVNHIQPDIIIDCAGVTPHQKHAVDAYHLNPQFTNNIIHAIHESGREIGLIYMSSVSVYGPPQSNMGVMNEDNALNPQSPYAQSKTVCERLIQKQDDIRSVIMRVANIAGKDAFINHVLKTGAATLRGDIPFERDIIDVRDITTMVERAIDVIIAEKPSMVVNCGSGRGYKFDDIIGEIEHQTGRAINVVNEPSHPDDIIRVICDTQRAVNDLNWEPQFIELGDIVGAAIKYHEQ